MKKVKRGHIYFANLSPTVGSEQDGIRPVLILQNDFGNQHSPTTIIAPITSKKLKHKFPAHVRLLVDTLPKPSLVLLEQIRTIDKRRLGNFVGKISRDEMGLVDNAIITSLGIKAMEEILK